MHQGGEKRDVDFGDVAGAAHFKDELARGFESGKDGAEGGVAGVGGAEDPVQCCVGDAG